MTGLQVGQALRCSSYLGLGSVFNQYNADQAKVLIFLYILLL